ncbi:MAG: hypothetical protein CL579_05740 [Alteromonadaceae bacterium]|nr:hypothetical protein [Alteromonadaceae bacterium]
MDALYKGSDWLRVNALSYPAGIAGTRSVSCCVTQGIISKVLNLRSVSKQKSCAPWAKRISARGV